VACSKLFSPTPIQNVSMAIKAVGKGTLSPLKLIPAHDEAKRVFSGRWSKLAACSPGKLNRGEGLLPDCSDKA